mmetsp:Transcript_17361/g.21941  ORF Transcript_17361/g.21941 Transcript_17361/m.21941 type:complete len:354 (+) Transcript_17361:150-1211(+)
MYISLSTLLLLAILTSRVLCHDEIENRKGNLRAALFQQSRTRKVMEKEYKKGLDFFIMGWPKTGTSAMMEYLDSSKELKIVTKSKQENAKLSEFHIDGKEDVDLLFDRIEEEYLTSDEGKEPQYGIKWPGAISGKGVGPESIEYLEKYNPEGTQTKLLIGMRHPVRWFESFYNYRARPNQRPPPSATLIGSHAWAGVCTDRVRYEEGIMQLGNFPLRSKDEEWIQGHGHMGVVNGGTPYKVFFYLQEQLSDDDKVRHGKFLEELSSFMEVKVPFTVDNDVPDRNHDHHKRFDICNKEHNEVRKVLVENGKETAKWIRANLADADGVTLPNKEHFLEIVNTFGTDPCDDEDLLS